MSFCLPFTLPVAAGDSYMVTVSGDVTYAQESTGQSSSWAHLTLPAGKSLGVNGAQRGTHACPRSLSIAGTELTIDGPASGTPDVSQQLPHAHLSPVLAARLFGRFLQHSRLNLQANGILNTSCFLINPEANRTSPKGLAQVLLSQIS